MVCINLSIYGDNTSALIWGLRVEGWAEACIRRAHRMIDKADFALIGMLTLSLCRLYRHCMEGIRHIISGDFASLPDGCVIYLHPYYITNEKLDYE
jgi:hypothetical protein